jgi:hypothetical protein
VTKQRGTPNDRNSHSPSTKDDGDASFDQERIDRINARLQPMVRFLADATVPLCEASRRRRVTPAGSGVLLTVAGRKYLLTASHVFDNAGARKSLSIIAGRHFVALAQERCWRTKAKTDTIDDPADLAVVGPDAEHPENWLGTRFIELNEIEPFDDNVERAPTTAFLALGYPRTKQPKSLRDGSYAAHAYHFLTHREDIELGMRAGVTNETHIAVGYERRHFVGDPAISEMPDPDGMSGGGLWRLPHALSSLTPEASLVGILIEQHSRHGIILASRVAEILHFLRTIDVANASSIDAHFPRL